MKLSMITRTVTGTISGYTVTKETTMKQIDTAQLDITACQAQAAEYHARGFNCAQAVAYKLSREIAKRFGEKNTTTVCGTLKGIGSDKGPLRSCPGCIDDAIEIACDVLKQLAE